MSVNQIQIGGSHYKSDFQHWDYAIVSLENRYLESAATKYISRWKKKNGIQDLEKSKHYLQKALEALAKGLINPLVPRAYTKADDAENALQAFFICSSIEQEEQKIIRLISYWEKPEDLELALTYIQDLIEEEHLRLNQ